MSQTRSAEAVHDDHEVARQFAEHHGLTHETGRRELVHLWSGYPFGVGSWRRARNVVRGELAGRSLTAFEYHYVTYSDDEGYDRDALHRFLICAIDLDHAVPPLMAVRNEWLEWHEDAMTGQVIEVDNPSWTNIFTLCGPDPDFARLVLTGERAGRCAEVHSRAEWRFDGDQLVVWVKGGHVGDQLHAVLDAVGPLIDAAATYDTSAVASGSTES
jgi:hypothetical protein